MTAVAAAGTQRQLVAGLAAYAGLVHLAVVPEHAEVWAGYALFFLATGVLQLGFAVACLHGPLRPPVVLGAIAATTALVLLYVASRTVGVPVGPEHAGHRLEPVGPLDLAAATAELGTIAALLPHLPAPSRRRVLDALLAVGVALWGWRLLVGPF